MTNLMIVAVIGLPGAGKSTLVANLQRTFGMRRVCRDALRAAMFPRCRYTPTEKRAAFRAVLLAAEVNLALGESTILDGMTLSRERDREKLVELAARFRVPLVMLWLDAPPPLARERIAIDLAEAGNPAGHPAGDRDVHLVDVVQERFEAPAGAAWIDAALPFEEVCAQAEAVVRERLTAA